VIGGTAKVASQAGAKAGAENAQAAQQAQAAAPQVPPTAEPVVAEAVVAEPAAAAPLAEESAIEKMDQLAKLKQLLDMSALTQDEFDVQKAKILASM
jgi:hypothetical protein